MLTGLIHYIAVIVATIYLYFLVNNAVYIADNQLWTVAADTHKYCRYCKTCTCFYQFGFS